MNFLLLAAESFYSPMILFFLLGLGASKIKSNLRLPRSITQAIGFYLILAIGFRGGVELVRHPLDWQAFATLLLSVFLSFNMPFLVYFLARRFLKNIRSVDAIAISAHYGSVSLVTFIASASFLSANSVDFESYLVVCITLMETPAIVAAMLMKLFWLEKPEKELTLSNHFRHIYFHGSSVLLVGSFLVGVISGNAGAIYTYGFLNVPFQGILCFFMLDMGLLAGLQLERSKELTRAIFIFGIFIPILCGIIGLLSGAILGLSVGGTALLAMLCASASYIVVPSAIRLSMPEANQSLAITLALGVTFPFNVIFGVPLFYWLSLQLV